MRASLRRTGLAVAAERDESRCDGQQSVSRSERNMHNTLLDPVSSPHHTLRLEHEDRLDGLADLFVDRPVVCNQHFSEQSV
jgi:hypothetical protein